MEDRITKVEKDIEYIKEDNKETKKEIKSISNSQNAFNLQLDRLTNALELNCNTTLELVEYMKEQKNKPNVFFDKVMWLFIGGMVSGTIGLLFAFLK